MEVVGGTISQTIHKRLVKEHCEVNTRKRRGPPRMSAAWAWFPVPFPGPCVSVIEILGSCMPPLAPVGPILHSALQGGGDNSCGEGLRCVHSADQLPPPV